MNLKSTPHLQVISAEPLRKGTSRTLRPLKGLSCRKISLRRLHSMRPSLRRQLRSALESERRPVLLTSLRECLETASAEPTHGQLTCCRTSGRLDSPFVVVAAWPVRHKQFRILHPGTRSVYTPGKILDWNKDNVGPNCISGSQSHGSLDR